MLKYPERLTERRVENLEHAHMFYHGTQERKLQRILDEGLKPSAVHNERVNYSCSDVHSIYVSTDQNFARDWARYNTMDGEKWVILAIPKDVVMENLEKLHPDDNLSCCVESWRLVDMIIEPAKLTVVEVGDRDKPWAKEQ